METGRYEGLRVEDRICPFCANDKIESEMHVMLSCNLYNDLRETLFNKAVSLNQDFRNLSDTDKLNFLFSDFNMIRLSAKTCFLILQRRQILLCK